MSTHKSMDPPRPLKGPLQLDKAIARADLNRGMKAILHAVGLHADFETWTCYPSVSTIARCAGYSEKQASIIIHQLVAKGVLHLDFKSEGGRSRDGRGIPHTYRLDMDRLESLANPEVTGGFTPKSPNPNPEVSVDEPRRGDGQTYHPSNQLNTPSEIAPEPAGESIGEGWMDGPDQHDLRAELRRHGIAGPNLDALVTSGKLTVDQVRAEAARVNTDRRVRDKAAVVFTRLRALSGIPTSTSQNKLSPTDFTAIARLEKLRRVRPPET